MQLTGKFIKADLIQEIKEGFEKRTFQIETDDKYNPVKCFELIKTSRTNNIEQTNKLKPGDMVEVFFNINQREHKGNWYTNLSAWKVEPVNDIYEPQEAPRNEGAGKSSDDLPF